MRMLPGKGSWGGEFWGTVVEVLFAGDYRAAEHRQPQASSIVASAVFITLGNSMILFLAQSRMRRLYEHSHDDSTAIEPR